jgi:hypothetical protein
MRNYHVNTNGWSDIGQYVTLLLDGTFVTGRDFGKDPASIKGFNTEAFACEMLGNFDKSHDVLQGKLWPTYIHPRKSIYKSWLNRYVPDDFITLKSVKIYTRDFLVNVGKRPMASVM